LEKFVILNEFRGVSMFGLLADDEEINLK